MKLCKNKTQNKMIYYISTMKVCFVCTCHINIIKQLRNSIINLTSLLVFILSRPLTARTGKPRPLLHIIDVFKLSQNQYTSGLF